MKAYIQPLDLRQIDFSSLLWKVVSSVAAFLPSFGCQYCLTVQAEEEQLVLQFLISNAANLLSCKGSGILVGAWGNVPFIFMKS